MRTNEILTGDCRDVLADLPESSVHMCMTSPPYFGLRDYGHDEQIGLEDELSEYVDELVAVGDELKRVLRGDGSWWLNLGDTYRDKQKLLVPERVAIALQRNGWILRNDVTWHKPNPMPQSVKDRLNTTTEEVFHLVPSKRYWYDLDAIREPYSESMERRKEYKSKHGGAEVDGWGSGNHHDGGLLDDSKTYGDTMNPAGKNPGDVFEVTTKPFPDAHFAVYPPELCEKPIKATCPPKVCSDCGKPYERATTDKSGFEDGDCLVCGKSKSKHRAGGKSHSSSNSMRRPEQQDKVVACSNREFDGWEQSCDCATDAVESGICLDPFAGAGTTLMKAKELRRRFIGIELNPEYADIARNRCGLAVENTSALAGDGQASVSDF